VIQRQTLTHESTQRAHTPNTQTRLTMILVSQGFRERIEDLRKQIDLMSDQLNRKDDQITQLNEVTQKQAVHIQSLIQENSKLNTKLLPEVIDNKPWWRFW